MNNKLVPLLLVVLLIGGLIYYQQHTHTASIALPGGHGVSVTTHD